LEKRVKENQPSDGRWEIYLKQKERFKEPEKIDGAELLVIDTASKPLDELISDIQT